MKYKKYPKSRHVKQRHFYAQKIRAYIVKNPGCTAAEIRQAVGAGINYLMHSGLVFSQQDQYGNYIYFANEPAYLRDNRNLQ